MSEGRAILNVDLDRPIKRLKASLQRASCLTALGLNSAPRLKQDDLRLPNTMVRYEFVNYDSWPIAQAQEEFGRWALLCGLRDAAEAVGHFLGSTRAVLAAMERAREQETSSIPFDQWQKVETKKRHKFGQAGLPGKVKHLMEVYRLDLDPVLTQHTLSINKARTCLVHGDGFVRPEDATEADGLLVSWRHLGLFVSGPNGERELAPMMEIRGPASVVARVSDVSKSFPVGTRVVFSVQEFSELCGTLYLLGQSAAANVVKWGRAHGIPIQERPPVDTPPTAPSTGPLFLNPPPL